MSFVPPPAYARRGEVVVDLTRSNALPPLIPGELRGIVLESEWTMRLTTVLCILYRFQWSLLTRVWLAVSVLATFVLPWPLFVVVRKEVLRGAVVTDDRGFVVSVDEAKFIRARYIQFSIFVGLAILFWLPYAAYAFIGRKRLANSLASMTQADAGKGTMMALTWSLVDTSTLRGRARILVRLPPAYTAPPTAWHPDAYPYPFAPIYAPPTYPPASHFAGDVKPDEQGATGGYRV